MVNYLFGCYYQEQMNPSTYEFDENNDIKLTTRDTTYHFKGDNYYLENDTLNGEVFRQLDKRRALKLKVEIPREQILDLEVKRADHLATLGIIVCIIVLPPIIMWGITTDFNFDFR